ncbi:hypothetical protein [Actinomadura sp. HBU206391]|uniref:hypothetical protein n=1 Tax=Actinomadura sp. HBU206391 TaxID=2731692 RepID=UPI00164FFBDD|nr:hypothetical protein [Actinomadura sp. HBU206391]MBC6460281.1 hypothetical protein [Actinomadura sp. HBU206391]
MRKLTRRLAIAILPATVAATMFSSPAHAATNPYTAAEACNNDFGGAWGYATDGHRVIYAGSTKVGDVYLMYNGSSGYNCVATLKSASVGTPTWTDAELIVQGSGSVHNEGQFKYYAAVQRYARGKCVDYLGSMYYSGRWWTNGRAAWGNCG